MFVDMTRTICAGKWNNYDGFSYAWMQCCATCREFFNDRNFSIIDVFKIMIRTKKIALNFKFYHEKILIIVKELKISNGSHKQGWNQSSVVIKIARFMPWHGFNIIIEFTIHNSHTQKKQDQIGKFISSMADYVWRSPSIFEKLFSR